VSGCAWIGGPWHKGLYQAADRYAQVELTFGDLAGVEICGKYLLIRIIRPRQHAPERIDNHAPAADQHGLRIVSLDRWVICWIVTATDILAGGEHETPPFERDMPHGGRPGLALIDRRGAMPMAKSILVSQRPSCGNRIAR
jgi:hypothetical protein